MGTICRSRKRSRIADVHLALRGQNGDSNYQRVTAATKANPVSKKQPQQPGEPGQSAAYLNSGLTQTSSLADGTTLLTKQKLPAASGRRLKEQAGEPARAPRCGQLIDILV
jgi:hypothetical protein